MLTNAVKCYSMITKASKEGIYIQDQKQHPNVLEFTISVNHTLVARTWDIFFIINIHVDPKEGLYGQRKAP